MLSRKNSIKYQIFIGSRSASRLIFTSDLNHYIRNNVCKDFLNNLSRKQEACVIFNGNKLNLNWLSAAAQIALTKLSPNKKFWWLR